MDFNYVILIKVNLLVCCFSHYSSMRIYEVRLDIRPLRNRKSLFFNRFARRTHTPFEYFNVVSPGHKRGPKLDKCSSQSREHLHAIPYRELIFFKSIIKKKKVFWQVGLVFFFYYTPWHSTLISDCNGAIPFCKRSFKKSTVVWVYIDNRNPGRLMARRRRRPEYALIPCRPLYYHSVFYQHPNL